MKRTPELDKILQLTGQEAERVSAPEITVGHLLAAIVKHGENAAARYLREKGVTMKQIRDRMIPEWIELNCGPVAFWPNGTGVMIEPPPLPPEDQKKIKFREFL